MKLTTCIILLLISFASQAQEFFKLRGYVTDISSNPIEGAYIRVTDLGTGTISNAKGQYEIRLPEGIHRVSFSFIGYESQRIDVVVNKNTTQSVRLKIDDNQLKLVEINNKRKDLSYDIIRQVIEQKEKYASQYITQKRSLYVKSRERTTTSKGMNKPSELDGGDEINPFSVKKDSVTDLNLFEGKFIQHKREPNGFKEEKIAATKFGSQRTLFYTSTTDADFDFFQNLIFCKKLGDNAYVSPIANTAFLSYKYKLLGSYFDKSQKIYRIRVTPRKIGNALFKGEIEVWDSVFLIKSLDLNFSKNSLILYDDFNLNQTYTFDSGYYLLVNELLSWSIKSKKNNISGKCNVLYTDYVFDSTYAKRYFSAQVGIAKEDAYEKDTTYWAKIRPIPLTDEEYRFIQYQDSLNRIKTSQVYLDSLDSAFNKVTALEVLWQGFGFINREKKTLITLDPAIGLIDPVAIGGFRLRYSASYYKKFVNRKSIVVSSFLNYGFRNEDLKGNLGIRHLYNPKKLSSISINAGKYFGFVNNFATITDIFNRSNFFEEQYISIFHRTELFNGFYTSTGLRNTVRSDLGNFKFNPQFDEAFENNIAQNFATHSAAILSLGFSYTPKQLYLQEPKEKIILGSRLPTFNIAYSQGLNKFLGSSANFKTLDFTINQKFNIGVIGSSKYSVNIGGFIDTSNIRIMDYRYQRGGDPFLLIPPMFGYQLIDSTFPTFGAVLETHYTHQFNGFLTSKIPGLKQLGIRTMVGGGFLYVPERDYQYSELLAGINRIFKVGKERVKFGLYYIIAQSNVQGFSSGFKFSLNPYNADTSTWSF